MELNQLEWTPVAALPPEEAEPDPMRTYYEKTLLQNPSKHTHYGVVVQPNSYSAVRFSFEKYKRAMHHIAQQLAMMIVYHSADAIAVRGTSGLSVAFALRMITDLPFIMVRKEGYEGHHGYPIESLTGGSIAVNRYIFLDDFIASGATIEAVRKALPDAKMVAALLYDDASSDALSSEKPIKWRTRDGSLAPGAAIYPIYMPQSW